MYQHSLLSLQSPVTSLIQNPSQNYVSIKIQNITTPPPGNLTLSCVRGVGNLMFEAFCQVGNLEIWNSHIFGCNSAHRLTEAL